MPTIALIIQMHIFYRSHLDFQILHMLFVCWQLMRYLLYLFKIKNAGSNENYSSACSLLGSCVFKVKQYEATLFFALLRCTETELCCYRLPPLSLCRSWWLSEERGPVIAVGRLCIQMTSLCCSPTARHGGQTPLLGSGGRGRFAWFTCV